MEAVNDEPAQPPGSESVAEQDLGFSQVELIARIRWLIHLRWVAFAGVTATILITREVFDPPLPWGRLLAAALLIPLYNLFFHLGWQRARRAGHQHLQRASSVLANAQIACDLVALGALIHFSGGIENLFGFYFIFHMVIASILLSRRAAFGQATLAFGIFAFVAIGEYVGVLPHYRSPVGLQVSGLISSPMALLAALWAMGSSVYVTVYLATSIACRLRQREDEVGALTRGIRRHADELQIAYDRLSELEHAKSAYARNVAHELRSPLAAIDQLLRSVTDGLHGEISDQVRDTLSRARGRTHGLLSLVSDLLTLAASRQARLLSEWTNVDLRQVLVAVVENVTASALARRIALKTQVDVDLPTIHADRKGIQELLGNLISNAVKYSLDGGEVTMRLAGGPGSVRIEVADSGIGIDEPDQEKVFGDFYRADNARQFTSDGTGLGLSIVKSIVEAHGGTIELNSRKGAGAAFAVTLPTRGGDSEIATYRGVSGSAP